MTHDRSHRRETLVGLEALERDRDELTAAGPPTEPPPARLRAAHLSDRELLEAIAGRQDAIEQETRGAALWRRQHTIRAERLERVQGEHGSMLADIAEGMGETLGRLRAQDERIARAEREARAAREAESRMSQSDLEIVDKLKHATADAVQQRIGLAVSVERDATVDARAARNKKFAFRLKVAGAVLAVAVTAANIFIGKGCHL